MPIKPVKPIQPIKNGLSVDVEDYFHAEAIAAHVGRDRWDAMESRVVNNTKRVLDLLEEHRAHATFSKIGGMVQVETSTRAATKSVATAIGIA